MPRLAREKHKGTGRRRRRRQRRQQRGVALLCTKGTTTRATEDQRNAIRCAEAISMSPCLLGQAPLGTQARSLRPVSIFFSLPRQLSGILLYYCAQLPPSVTSAGTSVPERYQTRPDSRGPRAFPLSSRPGTLCALSLLDSPPSEALGIILIGIPSARLCHLETSPLFVVVLSNARAVTS